MSRKILLPLLLVSLTGCQRARSFLHMNSNSSSPFLGFELSVDANDAQNRQNLPTIRNVARQHKDDSLAMLSGNDRNSRWGSSVHHDVSPDVAGNFVATSEARPMNGNLKYSLPSATLHSGTAEAEEIDQIISRCRAM